MCLLQKSDFSYRKGRKGFSQSTQFIDNDAVRQALQLENNSPIQLFINSDAAVPGLNRNVAYEQSSSFPPLVTQRKIAAILNFFKKMSSFNYFI